MPAQASAQDDVRCPHCQEVFKLSEILNQVVPELEVVVEEPVPENDVQDSEDVGVDQFVVPSQLAKGAVRRRRDGKSKSDSKKRDSNSDNDTFEATEVSITPIQPSVSKPGNESRRNRGKRRGRKPSRSRSAPAPSSPLVEIIKVAMGALLAIPIAYMLVMWVFQQDPLQVGPTLGRSVPALVPAKFRSETDSERPDDVSPDDSQGDDRNDDIPPENDEGPTKLAVPKINPDRVGRN